MRQIPRLLRVDRGGEKIRRRQGRAAVMLILGEVPTQPGVTGGKINNDGKN
jgi:hypothetical protein